MRWALAAIALLLAGTAGLLMAGEGGRGAAPSRAEIAWEARPQLILVPELPDDRIVSGRIRNGSLRPVDLEADRIQIVDADGRRLRSSARFLQSFVHGLYPASMQVEGSKFERTRLGKIATVKPGQALPLTVSWREPHGGATAVEIRVAGGSLALPR
jgi:hypothetical protein